MPVLAECGLQLTAWNAVDGEGSRAELRRRDELRGVLYGEAGRNGEGCVQAVKTPLHCLELSG